MDAEVSSPPLVAVALAADDDSDRWLGPVVEVLRGRGHRVGGMLAPSDELKDLCRRPMYLEDLMSGERVKISQDLGPESNSCSLDPGQLALAGRSIQRAIDAQAVLIIVNKFGKHEAAGEGLREELLSAAEAGIPVLTTVKPEQLAAWNDFVGEYGTVLPADIDAVVDWCERICTGQTAIFGN